MAERIGGGPGPQVLPHLDLNTTETAAAQLKETTRNLVPLQAMPLSSGEQLKSTGVTFHNSDELRLELPGKPRSMQNQVHDLGRVLGRLNASAPSHPFALVEGKMTPILKQLQAYYQQILSRQTHGRS